MEPLRAGGGTRLKVLEALAARYDWKSIGDGIARDLAETRAPSAGAPLVVA